MKKGFTLVEVIIATAILGSLLAVVGGVFAVAVKNYQTETAKTNLYREINYAADAISNELKNGAVIPSSYDVYTLSQNTLIIGLPALDENENFIYTEGVLNKDIYIYTLSQGNLIKKVIPDPSSSREPKESVVLTNVSSVNFSYYPDISNPIQVSFDINLALPVGKATAKANATRTANLRNK